MHHYLHAMRRYAGFSGRASRAEFWQFTLVFILSSFTLALLSDILFRVRPNDVEFLVSLWTLVHLLPALAVTVRRLHDIDRTGWWVLLNLTGIGSLIGFIFALMPGTEGTNRFGSAPGQHSSAPTGSTGSNGQGFFDDGGYRTPDDEVARPTTLRTARHEWSCHLYENLAAFTLTEGPITLNNVSLRSGLSILSGKRSGELTFSLVNRSREAQHPTVQVIVYDTTSPLPALAFSAEPLMGVIDGQTTEQLSASLNMRPGELDSLARFCVRLDG